VVLRVRHVERVSMDREALGLSEARREPHTVRFAFPALGARDGLHRARSGHEPGHRKGGEHPREVELRALVPLASEGVAEGSATAEHQPVVFPDISERPRHAAARPAPHESGHDAHETLLPKCPLESDSVRPSIDRGIASVEK